MTFNVAEQKGVWEEKLLSSFTDETASVDYSHQPRIKSQLRTESCILEEFQRSSSRTGGKYYRTELFDLSSERRRGIFHGERKRALAAQKLISASTIVWETLNSPTQVTDDN